MYTERSGELSAPDLGISVDRILTHALCMVTKSLRVIGHGSLPFYPIPANLFADGAISGAFPCGISQKFEEVRSFLQNACINLYSMANGRQLCAALHHFLRFRPGPAKQKRRCFEISQCKTRDSPVNHQCIGLTMHMHKRILVEVFFRIPVLLILVDGSTFALSLMVTSIISSFVSQAILSIFSGHVL